MPPCALGDDTDHDAERDHAQDALRDCDVDHIAVAATERLVTPSPLACEKFSPREPRRTIAPAGQPPRGENPRVADVAVRPEGRAGDQLLQRLQAGDGRAQYEGGHHAVT